MASEAPIYGIFFGSMVNLMSAFDPISAERSVLHGGASMFNVQCSCADKNMVGRGAPSSWVWQLWGLLGREMPDTAWLLAQAQSG